MAEDHQQVELGLALLARAKNPETIAAAAGMFGESVDPRIGAALAEKYRWLSAEPRRRDYGCFQRLALMRAMRVRSSREDLALLEAVLATVEIVGRFDAASDLRAAALIALNEADGRLASFHAARMLHDAHEMSGQPAVTAARLLGSRDELLPLYVRAYEGGQHEVVAECLRGLTALPETLVLGLVERYRHEKDEAVLLGLFELLLGHQSRSAFAEQIASFLDGTMSLELYRFLVNSIVASRDLALVALLRRKDGPSADSPKGLIVAEALTLMPR